MRSSSVAALLRLSSLGHYDWESALQEILRVDSELLDVGRVSYWCFRDDPARIFCELGFVADGSLFERGAVLYERTSPTYFAEIKKLQLIDASDGREDARTRDLVDYLDALNVGALLDAPVCSRGQPVGILCHEHVGGPRAWTPADEEFALAVAQTLTAMLESRARSKSEQAERNAIFLSDAAAKLAKMLEPDAVARLAVHEAVPLLGDMAALLVFDGGCVRLRAAAHANSDGQRVMDELIGHAQPRFHGGDVIARTIRERQSLIIPAVEASMLSALAAERKMPMPLLARLKIRSAMVVPLVLRPELVGGMTFMSSRQPYEQDDLLLAEAYARQVGGNLESALLYEQARQAVRVRDEFLSLASHELRTPLTALRAATAAMLHEVESGGTDRENLARMTELVARQVERLDRLNDRMLDASQLAGGLSLCTERVDLADVANKAAEALARRANRSGSPLQVIASEPVFGVWDAARLEQLVIDLLDNAIKFGAGRPIELSVRETDGSAVLTIRDHGIGIAEQPVSRIFERYHRSVSPRSFGGLGLGLYRVAAIVHAHGGRVEVETRVGEGSTFTVTLPQRGPTASTATEAA